MKTFFQTVNRYLHPYRAYIFLNVLFNLLGVVFSLLSMVLIGAQVTMILTLVGVSRGVLGTQMPHFDTTLTEPERWQVVEYIRTLSITNTK